jgi:hypothetical protein
MEYLNENNLNGMLPETIEFKFIKKNIDLKKNTSNIIENVD